ncbi:MAG: hypothetical protein JWO77_2614 [Ilumatobacteraceae bacterium]|nr:hypothetical protein [Ilumatobacteraceae bacterium]
MAWTTRPALALDDAAISFRYAERLATGRGLTYNDGEHVLGASSGLHTILLAVGRWFGLPVTSTAVVLGVVGLAGCTALIGLIASRLGGRTAALVAMLLFIAGPVRSYATGGLESTTLIAGCLVAVAALQAGRERLTGIALGVALVAKLDAGALLVAVVGVHVLLRHRLPLRMLAWTALAAAPWFVWATWVYGNPLPQSLLSKASGRADVPGASYDPTWALRRVRAVLPAAVAGVAVAVRRRDDPPGQETRLVLVAWLVLAGAAVSLLPLGAPYPWYVAPLYAPIAILAGDAAGWVRGAVRQHRWQRAAVVVPALLIALSCVLLTRNLAVDLGDGVARGPAVEQWEDLRAAGRAVDARHRGEVVRTCFGWSAFEADGSTIEDPCALNSPWPADRATVRIDAVPADQVGRDGDGGGEGDLAGWCVEERFDGAARRTGGPVVVVRVRC